MTSASIELDKPIYRIKLNEDILTKNGYVKVVHCCECAKRDTSECGFEYDGLRWDYCDGYCSYGERKTDERIQGV